jgi:response regulator NasT
VQIALETSPDLVLMDICLPRKDGLWAAREILAHRTAGMIFITGHDDNDLLAAACQSGGLAYLLKPVSARQMETAIEVAWARLQDLSTLRSQVEGLEEALAVRKQVERAKGILMDRLGLPEEEAYRRLQKQARDTNQKLSQVAAAVIAAAGTLWGQDGKPSRKRS